MKNGKSKTTIIKTETMAKITRDHISVQLIPVKEMQGYEEEYAHFDAYLYRRYASQASYECKEAFELAKILAKQVDEICVAKVRDHFGEFYISESCNKGCSEKFVLFNARTVYWRSDGELHVTTPNMGRGALTVYWYDRYVKFEKGSVA